MVEGTDAHRVCEPTTAGPIYRSRIWARALSPPGERGGICPAVAQRKLWYDRCGGDGLQNSRCGEPKLSLEHSHEGRCRNVGREYACGCSGCPSPPPS